MRGVAAIIPVGTVFERLTVVGPSYVEVRQSKTRTFKVRCLPCKCTCGNKKGIPPSELTSGRTRSCGCLHRELLPVTNRTHGGTRSQLYRAYNNMYARCYNPKIRQYTDYGGRGITICPEWLADFVTFRDWALANGFEYGLTIERKDVNGNYEPGNCTWIPLGEQSRNRRNVPMIEYLGEAKILSDWGRDPRCAVRLKTLLDRMKQGWSFERAFTEPRKKT